MFIIQLTFEHFNYIWWKSERKLYAKTCIINNTCAMCACMITRNWKYTAFKSDVSCLHLIKLVKCNHFSCIRSFIILNYHHGYKLFPWTCVHTHLERSHVFLCKAFSNYEWSIMMIITMIILIFISCPTHMYIRDSTWRLSPLVTPRIASSVSGTDVTSNEETGFIGDLSLLGFC